MKKRVSVVATGIALLVPAPAWACGHCAEDRAAMVYDHGVAVSARNGNRQMAFFAIEGSNARFAEVPGVVARALASLRGVNPRSLRISMDAAALSFSFDRRTTAPAVAAALDAVLANLGIRIVPLEGIGPPGSRLAQAATYVR